MKFLPERALLPVGLPAGLLVYAATPVVASLSGLFVPPEAQLPGTQPGEVAALLAPKSCDNCHGGYDATVEPAHNWRGSLMAHASVDPLFWATLALTEQAYDGAGDLCLRCHMPSGWLDGRSTPTDGSGFLDSDAIGVDCHLCHRLVSPDESEFDGVQNAPYVAHDGGSPPEAYVGSGIMVLLGTDVRLGPYADATSNNHATAQSQLHRSGELCGTCHDVSNPITGDLAHNHGTLVPLAPGTFDGAPGGNVDDKAAFNNYPHAYGAVERTYSEWKSSALSGLLVEDYPTLPSELRNGSIEDAYVAAVAVRPDGHYEDGTPRSFTCQTCHMKPKSGKGAKQSSAPVRDDLPAHDLTGGSTWMPDAIAWMNQQGTLQLGGSLSNDELAGLAAGKARALENLQRAAAIEVTGDEVRVVNLTGHKLPTGYPEGRRMWLNVRWYDDQGALLREDGEYGSLQVQIGGQAATVETLLDLHDPNMRLYVAHPGLTSEWAQQLLGLGYPRSLALEYDRVTGAVSRTLGQLANQPAGTIWKTDHFALNNAFQVDSRIPPYGLPYDDALERSILPLPADQYGDPGPGGVYDHADAFALAPPAGAVTADLRLLYQSTSWEFIQFLELANDGSIPFLQDVGRNMREAWQATGMAPPVEMASATWSAGDLGVRYCDPAVVNSSGLPGRITAAGSLKVTDQTLSLTASQLPFNQFGYFLVSATQGFVANPGGSQGNLCLAGTIGRYAKDVKGSGGTGSFSLNVDMTLLPAPLLVPIQAGDTWNFTTWFRDKNPTNTSNFTDAISLTFL